MALNDRWRIVQLTNQAIVGELALLCAQAHCAAEIALLGTHFNITFFITPLGNERHNRVLTVWHKFRRVGVIHTRHITCKLNQRNLHTQANAQIRNIVFTRIACGSNFTFDATVAETTRNQDSI